MHLEFSTYLRILVVLYSNGQIALCSVSKKGLRQSGAIIVERWLTTEGATCTSFASDQKILAVGCSRGVVELYDLSESAQVLRTISLFDWGYVPNSIFCGTTNESVNDVVKIRISSIMNWLIML
jgi:RAB6A-GEF complex partner protein 1